MKKFIVAIALAISVVGTGFAKPSGGTSHSTPHSSSFSKPSSSSSSKPSSSWSRPSSSSSKPSSSWSSSKPSSNSKPSSSWSSKPSNSSSNSSSSWGSKPASENGFSSSKTVPSADTNTYNKAKQNGTVFTDKNTAAASFKEKYNSKYTSTFKTEPKVRPSYIPPVYRDGGNSYNITYNVGHGGYGYTNSLGQWIIYDMMRDSVMRDRYMVENNYYTTDQAPTTVVYSNNSGDGLISFVVFIFVIVIIVLIVLAIIGSDLDDN